MGLVDFLRFSLLCLDILAWPTFALGYPIWQSIRAIETGSKYHMKKLVIYWIIFSLISLLEHTFKLIQWVPFWPYIKLTAICWLVIPRFNGASRVYQGLVHPCLSLNLQTVINWFRWPQDNETFLTSVETYLKENKSEALEKLITSKGKHKEHHVADAQKDMERMELTEENVVAEEPRLSSIKSAYAQEDTQRMEPTDKNTTAEGQPVKHPLENLANTENKTTVAVQVPKLSIATVFGEERPMEIPVVKKVQREWTFAVCQLTTTSEVNLNSHLMGKRHKTMSEELKIGKQAAKDVQSSILRATGFTQLSRIKNADAREDIQRMEPVDKNTAAEGQSVKHPLENLANIENNTITAAQVPKLSMPIVVDEKICLEIPSVKKVQREWTCTVCQLTTTNEATIVSHLMGKRHKKKSEELNTGEQTAKNVQSSTLRATDLMHLSNLENGDAWEDIQIVEPTNKNTAAEAQSVKHARENLANTDNNTTTAAQVPKLSMPIDVEEKTPMEIPAVKKVQREWTCTLCQLTTTSEATIISHLMGKRHKKKSEELKTGEQTAKNVQSFTLSTTDLMQLLNLKNADAYEDIQITEPTDKNTAAEGQLVKHVLENLTNTENNTTTAAQVPKLSVPIVVEEKIPMEILAVKKVQRHWTCTVCQLTTTSEATIISHLMGKRHKKKSEELKTSEQIAENVQLSTLSATDLMLLSNLKNADAREDIQIVEPTDKYTTAEGQSVKHVLENLAHTENNTTTVAQVPNLSMPIVVEEKIPMEIPAVKKIQREWTCTVCQLTTTSEATIISHLMGKRHKKKSEELKVGEQIAKNVQSSTLSAADLMQLSNLKNADAREDIPIVEPTDKNNAVEGQSVKHVLENLANAENNTTTAAQVPKLSMPIVVEEKIPMEIPAVKKVQREWTCTVCQLTTTREATIISHLMGKRHKKKFEELKTGEQIAKNVQSSTLSATDLMQLSNLKDADVHEDIPIAEPTDKNTVAEGQSVEHVLENLANTENNTTTAAQVPKLSMPIVVEEKIPMEIPAVKKAQREWTCTLCQLTSRSEATIISHLMGKRHKKKFEELKTGEQTTKNVQSSTLGATNLVQLSKLKNANGREDISIVEPTDKNTAAEGRSVNHPLENLANIENNTITAAQVPKLSMPTVVEEKIPLDPAMKKIQREWTCAVCQLTTTTEATLNSHLMGKRHKKKSEGLKASEQTAKNVQSSTSRATDLMQLSSLKNADALEDIQRVEPTDENTAAEGQSAKHPLENLANSEYMTATIAQVPKLSMPVVIEEKTPLEIPAVKKVQNEWTCALCQVTTTSEATLNSHLQGKRHGKQTAKNVESSTSRATDLNHEHKKPKICVPGEKSEQNPTEKQENVHYSAATVKDMPKMPYNLGNLIQHSNLWCSICNIKCCGEIDMAVHLNGREHLYKVQSLLNFGSGGQKLETLATKQ